MGDRKILVGVFGAPHGVKGELRLKSYTQDPLAVAAYGPLSGEGGEIFEIAAARPVKDDILVVRVKGVADRSGAEKLTNQRLYVARSLMPPPDEEEFYYDDLIGLRAETPAGEVLGTVAALQNFGAGDILEVKPPTGDTLLLPFTRTVVPMVDLAGGRVIVVPPEETQAEPDPESKG